MKITGTFLDEISYDIPHQNWGREEWDQDFAAMKTMGINKVILIRCGLRRWMTYSSQVLQKEQGCFVPSVDLVQMFLELAQKHGLAFFFGTYDSAQYWHQGQAQKELDLNRKVIDEVWKRYGNSPAFKGWYLTQEVSRNIHKIIDIFAQMGRHCKEVSGNLPVLISPYIQGIKDVSQYSQEVARADGISPEQHEREWGEIMAGIKGAVDIVAFQDGHVDFGQLKEFLVINKALADKNGLTCWTNSETFDRDMPIKFLPIKWEKLLYKLRTAEAAGYSDAITFEFSHFMSPNSCYPQAAGLFDRYCEYHGLTARAKNFRK
jgi:hypothetical protein